jgi:hypothetical protein
VISLGSTLALRRSPTTACPKAAKRKPTSVPRSPHPAINIVICLLAYLNGIGRT